jgi:hypothetical protein
MPTPERHTRAAPTHPAEARLESAEAPRSQRRRELMGMSYAEGATHLAPVQMESSTVASPSPPRSYSETATAKLTEQMSDDDYELEDLCYMDTHNRMVTILREYSSGLAAVKEPDTDGSRATEVALISRLVGYLEYAQKIVPDNKNRNSGVSKSETVAAAFPDLTAKEASKEAMRLYHIASTQPSSVRRAPGTFRGAGVGGALAKMGGGELVYRDEIAAGKLKPGAPLQYWGAQSLFLHGRTEEQSLDGKGVYQAIVANRVDTSKTSGIFGHSITFVRYDESSHNIIHCTDYGGSLNSYDVTGNSPYFIGANISTSGEATTSAEYVLQSTGFRADQGADHIAQQATKYRLDAGKLAAALTAGINASGHASLGEIQASATHHGTPSGFDHTMSRLIGLWQYAVGTTVDGLFGNVSCARLTGNALKDATTLQVSAPVDVAGPTLEAAGG